MIKCSDCGASQQYGALFCNECGNFLQNNDPTETAVLPFSTFANRPPPPPLNMGQLELDKTTKEVTIVIPSSRRRILLKLAKAIRVGRADPNSGLELELDLTDDGGADKGVSRLHAEIKSYKQGIVLIDLGSTNGTLLNTYRLPPEQPYPLQSGDVVRFGELLIHLFFD